MILQHPRWTDQPEFEEFNGLLDMLLDGPTMVQVAEVTYKGKKGVAVSAGNLFGSQTIMVKDCREAILSLNDLRDVCHAMDKCKTEEERKEYTLCIKDHPGWELLPNKEKEHAEKA